MTRSNRFAACGADIAPLAVRGQGQDRRHCTVRLLAVVLGSSILLPAAAADADTGARHHPRPAATIHGHAARAGRSTALTAATVLFPGEKVISWTWTYGDGARSAGRGRLHTEHHTYRRAGRYRVILTATTSRHRKLVAADILIVAKASTSGPVASTRPTTPPTATTATTPTAQPTVAGPGAPTGPASVPSLAADTTVIADHDGYVDVTLPSQATISAACQQNPDITVTGPAGTPVAFALHRDGDSDTPLVAVRPAAPADDITAVDGSCDGNGSTVLPAAYRLWLLTAGPATAVLHLGGLTGATTISPTSAPVARLATAPALTSAATTYTAGDNTDLPGTDLSFVLVDAHTGPEAGITEGECYYPKPATNPGAYGPGCPVGGTETMNQANVPNTNGLEFFSDGDATGAGNAAGLGGYVQSEGTLTDATVTTLRLGY